MRKGQRRRPQDVFKTSQSRRIYSPQSYFFRRRLENVFKTSGSRPIYSSYIHLQGVLQKRLQDIFKTCCKDILKTFSRRPSNKLFAQATILRNLWSVQKTCKCDKDFSSFNFSLDYIFQWLLTEAFLEPGRTSTRKLFFAKILHSFKLLAIFVKKSSVADVRLD